MKSVNETICFAEIPDETSLSFSISNCPNQCEGCHSPWLREDVGRDVDKILVEKLERHKDLITCILFFGGDDDRQKQELKEALAVCKAEGYKTALYSGFDNWPQDDKLLELLDYIKIGRYDFDLGPLTSKTTNQRLYKKSNGEWEDITYKFWTSVI